MTTYDSQFMIKGQLMVQDSWLKVNGSFMVNG